MVLPTQSEAGGFVLARFYAHSVTKTGGLLAVLGMGWAGWEGWERVEREVEETLGGTNGPCRDGVCSGRRRQERGKEVRAIL